MIAASGNTAALYRWSWRRVALALSASLLVHYLLADSWPVSGGGRPVLPLAPELHAQLEVPDEPLTVPAADTADLLREHAKTRSSRAVSIPVTAAVRPSASAAASEIQPSANSGSNIPDPRFFPARELDRYPAPVEPLDFRGMGARVGLVRAWVSIDLAGNVVDVEMVDIDPSGVLQRQLREQLLAVQFMPGMKNDRPVRSRILLELVIGR
jgi:hypothetical protein